MSEDNKSLGALVQEKMETDVDFQSSLDELSDEDKNQALEDKRKELMEAEFALVAEKAKKAEENYNNQKIRAKKAEAEAKKPHSEELSKTEGLTPKDYLALTENSIKSDEFDRVVELSTLLQKSVTETLQDKTAQQILKTEREERATVNATSTSAKARKGNKSSKEIALSSYQEGKLPETEEDSKNLAEAQFEQLLKRE